ncbi:MAG: chromosomal replication initiator protein DnaA [Spirochaetaceae bacterium]|nr:chromosomal replication initiator protein DnaA [Spirochaetaceae bacterium]
MLDYSAVWQEAMRELRKELTDTEYMMWLNKLGYEASREGAVVACVPSKLILDQVKLRYSHLLEEKLEELAGEKLALEFVVKKNTASSSRQEKKEAPAGEPPKPKAAARHSQLNEKYSFETFVIGESNKFAANAAVAVAKNPGTAYNPLLIYGGVGLGKTHLLQAIGNAIHKNFDAKKLVSVTAENFTNEFIYSIGNKTTQKFKNKYRSVDVLLIDDIHFLQKKEDTLEELFHTFIALHDNKKQIVFTCDRPISELKYMEDRIKSRFRQGTMANLQSPSYETRYAIVKQMVDSRSLNIPADVIDLICNNITTNVRELEAAIENLTAYGELIDKEITLDIAQKQLRDLFSSPQEKKVTIDIIKRTVADYYDISFGDLSAKKRTKALSDPRQVAMYICRQITEYAFEEIGQEFGKNYSTVMHACGRIKDKMKSDPTLEGLIHNLIQKTKENSIKE